MAVATAASLLTRQARFPMKYLDEVGELGFDPNKKSVDLGLASVVSDNGALRFEGRDHKGEPWRVWVPQTSGAGWMEVWTADFDHNGEPDLLVGSHGSINGRCVGRTDLLFLLFDQSGRPSPWYVSTEIPNGKKYPYLPAILLDLNRDGRAEIISTSCEYARARILGRLERDRGLRSERHAVDTPPIRQCRSLPSSGNQGEWY